MRLALVFVALCLLVGASRALKVAVIQAPSVNGDSPEQTVALNAATIASMAMEAAANGAEFVNSAEFQLTGSFGFDCSSTANISMFGERVPADGEPIGCIEPLQSAMRVIGCGAAAQHPNLTISYNTVELASNGSVYNTEVILRGGVVVTSYRKMHPFYPKCFDTPGVDLKTFNASGVRFGLATCYDIAFFLEDPFAGLLALGVRHFSYSSAIPIIGADAVALFSKLYSSTMVSANIAAGQSAVVVNGTTIASAPASQPKYILYADVY